MHRSCQWQGAPASATNQKLDEGCNIQERNRKQKLNIKCLKSACEPQFKCASVCFETDRRNCVFLLRQWVGSSPRTMVLDLERRKKTLPLLCLVLIPLFVQSCMQAVSRCAKQFLLSFALLRRKLRFLFANEWSSVRSLLRPMLCFGVGNSPETLV